MEPVTSAKISSAKNENEIPRKPRRHDPTPKEAAHLQRIPAREKKRLTDNEILDEYRRLPFINRIVKMGVSIQRVRSVVRSAGLA